MEKKLPKGWTLVGLNEIVYFQEGPGLRKFQYRDQGIPFLNIRTIEDGKIKKELCGFLSSEEVKEKYTHFLLNEGDIICSTSGTIGKTAVIKNEDLPLLLNTSIIRFKSRNANLLNQVFIHYYLKSNWFFNQASELSTGTAQKNLGPSHLEKFQFPLPPLPTQQRIVAKLDSLFARIEQMKSSMERIPQLLKAFRQSVLTQAVTGKLTEEWREGRELEEWETFDLSQIGEVTGGVTLNSKRNQLPIQMPYLRVANVYTNRLELDEIKQIGVTKDEVERTLLKKGDLLIVEGNGSPDQIGRASQWNNEIDNCLHQNHLIKFRPYISIDSKFVLYFLLSDAGRQQIQEISKSSSGLYTLSISKISKLQIDIPPLEEQQEIVRQVESLFAKADRIEAQYQSLKAKIEQLPQALLAKAFRGELVEQLPEDGDAQELLEALRQAQGPGKGEMKRSGTGKILRRAQDDTVLKQVAEPEGKYWGKK